MIHIIGKHDVIYCTYWWEYIGCKIFQALALEPLTGASFIFIRRLIIINSNKSRVNIVVLIIAIESIMFCVYKNYPPLLYYKNDLK
jgi:hypothetical protein